MKGISVNVFNVHGSSKKMPGAIDHGYIGLKHDFSLLCGCYGGLAVPLLT